MRSARLCLLAALLGSAAPLQAQANRGRRQTPDATPASDTSGRLTSAALGGLKFRNVGPAVTGGRIGEVVIHPSDRATWYVGVHSSGVWKTTNAGTTWTPVFDREATSSIGHLAIDPSDPLTIWVGTGENNSQRSVGFGDGVYKSTDGGRSWKNVGLKNSAHIGTVAVDPRNGQVAYVAATGPLWSAGGDRGVYKTTDGGASWTLVLKPDNEWTGAQSLVLDPVNPDILYATTWQRARRQWGFIDGGPGSSVYKSADAGATWVKITKGLPTVELGKIGLAISPVDAKVLYAVVEAADSQSGLYRSADGGQNWDKRSSWAPTSAMYYSKIYPDPKDVDKIYLVDTRLQVSSDGGRTTRSIQSRSVHVDHHALWIDPTDTRHLINGNDGGLYESFDTGATWNFKGNLSLTQFYKLSIDNALPFYNICGGTQDNNTLCGPSQTINSHGQTNADWYIVVGGDGFQPRIDPADPNIIYGEWQHGELVRFDKRTGEAIDIQPQPEPGEPPLRWNWDSPIIISPHAHTRLYFGAQRLYRSDDRGDSWRAISGDLTRNLDRNQLQMMGRRWSMDAIAKNTSTSFFGTLVSVSESSKQEGLLYAGTDDGLIQITEDGGTNWRKVETIQGIPDTVFVSDLQASRHDANVVYATFNNHKAGDYKPYVVRSDNRGGTWTSIAGNLPERGPVWTIAEDHVDPNLLFVGTEFGVFASVDGGKQWTQLKSGLPTTPVMDIAIQERENDLVLATFGRGFYILHDYSPLRGLVNTRAQAAVLLPVRNARLYAPADPIGGGPKGSQGDALWTAPNPEFGTTFTYYLKDAPKSLKATRRAAEKDLDKKNADVPVPSWDDLRKEDQEEAPAASLVVTDQAGGVVRRLVGPTGTGFQRVTWNLRYPAPVPVTGQASGFGGDGGGRGPTGPMVPPGTYSVQLVLEAKGVETPVGTPHTFRAEPALQGTLPTPDQAAVARFNQDAAKLQRAAMGAGAALGELENRLKLLGQAIDQTPTAGAALRDSIRAARTTVTGLRTTYSGDRTIASRSEPTPVTITERLQRVIRTLWQSTAGPTATHRRSMEVAAQEFSGWLPELKTFAARLVRIEAMAESAGVPWTPGRLPNWTP